MAKRIGELFKDLGFIFKFIECICCIINCIMVASYSTLYFDPKSRDLTLVTVAGYLMITAALLIIYICDEKDHIYELIVLIVGAILNLVTCILGFITYGDTKHMHHSNTLIIALFSLICGVIMAADWIRELKKGGAN